MDLAKTKSTKLATVRCCQRQRKKSEMKKMIIMKIRKNKVTSMTVNILDFSHNNNPAYSIDCFSISHWVKFQLN
jgi:hypothetical protein